MPRSTIQLPWGEDSLSMSLPANWQVTAVLEPAPAPTAADPESEASRNLRHQMFENSRGLDEMLSKEREVIYNDLAQELGYRDAEVTNFVGYLNYVNKVTSPPDFHRRRGQPRPESSTRAAASPAANQ